MISVDQALALAGERQQPPPTLQELTLREKTQVDYIESIIEIGLFKSYSGGVFAQTVDANLVESKVIQHAMRRFESAGWSVGVFPLGNGDKITDFLLTFAPSSASGGTTVPKWPPEDMPPLIHSPSTSGAGPRLLVRMPTRDRPKQALAAIEKYRRMAGCPIQIEVITDYDDSSMTNAEVLQRLVALDCVVTTGFHRSKVDACNAGQLKEWDVLMLASDDMVPVVDGYAARVLAAMEEHWPNYDGALYFNDGKQRESLCTLPIFGKRLYDQFGYVYERHYKSLFCDREQTDLLLDMGRLTYVDEVLIEHWHHAWGRAERDALYERNDAFENRDREIYERRRDTRLDRSQFAFAAPPMWLSIGICTVAERKTAFRRLVNHLYHQIRAISPRYVEILVDDRPTLTIGEKRQALLERAKGHFVAFIDDDDWVSHDYISRVVSAIATDPDADCTSLVGTMTTLGARPERFEHSLQYERWELVEGVHRRCPNHLNAVKRELALQVGFVAKNHGEDSDYSERLRPLLKRETSTGSWPLYYYWYMPK